MQKQVDKVRQAERKAKKVQRKENKEGLRGYYTRVVNTRTGYTQIVSHAKAFAMIHGERDAFGILKLNLKDIYAEVKING